MKKAFNILFWAVLGTSNLHAQSLQEAFGDYFRMGVSVNQWEVKAEKEVKEGISYSGAVSLDQTANYEHIARHFGWVVPENCMKCEVIHPQEGVYDFTLADQLVDKALANGQQIIGHCLIWHSQCAPWFFVDEEGKQVSAEVLKKRMRDHIFTILGHFRGRIVGWDVVNEAFEDNGSFRRSKFYEILGEDFIPLAFQYAHEADPNVELYYNDFSMNKRSKVDGVVNFFRPLVAKGLPIDAIGMQGHMIYGDTDYVKEYTYSIKAIASIGLKSQFTELDLTMLPNPFGFSGANVSDNISYKDAMDPYKDGLPKEKQEQFDQFWLDFFQMLMDNKENVIRATFWCLNDANSWRNDFPIKGRTDYATLFDRQCKPKPAIQKLIDMVKDQEKKALKENKPNKNK